MKNGSGSEDSRKYYYENNVKVTGWKETDGKCYYFSRANGAMYGTNCGNQLLHSFSWIKMVFV